MVVVNPNFSIFCWLFGLCHLACSNSELYEGVSLIHKTNTEQRPVASFIRATQWSDTQMPTTTRRISRTWKVLWRPSGPTDFDSSVFGYGNQVAHVKPALIHEPSEIETTISLSEPLNNYTPKTARSLFIWRLEFKAMNSVGRFCWFYCLHLTSALNRGGFSETSITCFWNISCKVSKSGVFHIHCRQNSKYIVSP